MASVDLRESLNAISDVVHNRPPPLREFDQIYMKAADMLLQAEHAGRCLANRDVLFIGDGDAIGLSLMHLHQLGIIPQAPRRVVVLDFDERVVLSIRRFAKHYGIADRIEAELYNVADPLPNHLWNAFDGFYSNPPFGASNGGRSIEAFLSRAVEATGSAARGCVVIADDDRYAWTQEVLYRTQQWAVRAGFVISELIPKFHRYHLDDAPDLTSCSLVLTRVTGTIPTSTSTSLHATLIENFYGAGAPLKVRYIRDRTSGGRFPSRDHQIEPYESETQ